MTTTFADNVVGPQTTVYSGSLSFHANDFPGGATPNVFGPTIDLTTAYTYSGGSLLIEFRRGIRSGSTTSINTDVDSTVATQAGARWLFNTSSDTAVTGSLSNGGHVFQLTYTPVPEPASAALAGIAAITLASRRRTRSA
jgi:hypothetical protein